jgi:hypothetical protein
MKPHSRFGAAALIASAALAIPAVANAHPTVYPTWGNLAVGTAPDPITLEPQTRYVVVNHGYPWVFRESNGIDDSSPGDLKYRGVIGYNLIPGAWRAGKTFAEIVEEGAQPVQAHAICETPLLTSEAVIRAWQGGPSEDPFYNYVPFQAEGAGLDDDPADWLPVLTDAGFDVSKLNTAANAKAECERLGGVYYPADEVQTAPSSLASGLLAHTVEPLQEQIDGLEAEKSSLSGELTTVKGERDSANAQVSSLTAEVARLNAEVARLRLEAAPLKLTLGTVKKSGATATVSGPPERTVRVTLSITSKQAKKLKLRSTTIAAGTVKTSASGEATLSLKPKSAVAKKLKGSFSVSAQAVAGDRVASAKGKFTR